MIAHRARLDVPRELTGKVARLRHAERRRRGTRGHSRALTRWRQALSGLVPQERRDALAAGLGVRRATAYRYREEIINVLAAQAPDLHEALRGPGRGFCPPWPRGI